MTREEQSIFRLVGSFGRVHSQTCRPSIDLLFQNLVTRGRVKLSLDKTDEAVVDSKSALAYLKNDKKPSSDRSKVIEDPKTAEFLKVSYIIRMRTFEWATRVKNFMTQK